MYFIKPTSLKHSGLAIMLTTVHYTHFSHMLFLLLIVVILAIFVTPVIAYAAIFSFDPADLRNDSQAYRPGFTFTVKFLLDTEGAEVGVADGAVLFSSDNVEVVRILTEYSIFHQWAREPRLIPNTNIVEFAGEVLGGFSGKGEIFSVTFRVKTEETTYLFALYTRALQSAALPNKLSARREEAWYPFAIPDHIPKDFAFARDLTIGDRSLDVAYLQLVLRIEELYHSDISGRFDGITRDAVLAFQERYAEAILIPGRFDRPTGKVDFWTRAKLNRLLPLIVFEEPKLSPEQVSEESLPLFDVEVRPGEEQRTDRKTAIIILASAITGVAVCAAIYILRRKKYLI